MRKPSVFVRQLGPEEGQRLQRVSRTSKRFATRQRAAILLASASEMSPAQIARALGTEENQVRRVIHEFNERGFDSLRPRVGGGRPRRVDQATRDRIVAIALARPRDAGEALTRWSLRRLRRHLIRRGICREISVEGLRQILRGAGLTYQRSRTWKASPDPDYEAKAARILRLYRAAEQGRLKDAVVVCFDECGPISLRPWPGSAWAPMTRPARTRATYRRPHGVSYLFGAFDVGADHLSGCLTRCKDASQVLRFLGRIRARYPVPVRIHLVMDNLSTHWTREIRRFARGNRMSLVPLPTYASYLNRIECHFFAYREFVINGSDYPDHQTLAATTRAYLRQRNRDHRAGRIRELENRRKVA